VLGNHGLDEPVHCVIIGDIDLLTCECCG
jgi:hypothetical protein